MCIAALLQVSEGVSFFLRFANWSTSNREILCDWEVPSDGSLLISFPFLLVSRGSTLCPLFFSSTTLSLDSVFLLLLRLQVPPLDSLFSKPYLWLLLFFKLGPRILLTTGKSLRGFSNSAYPKHNLLSSSQNLIIVCIPYFCERHYHLPSCPSQKPQSCWGALGSQEADTAMEICMHRCRDLPTQCVQELSPALHPLFSKK